MYVKEFWEARMKIDKLTKEVLSQIMSLHEMDEGAVSLRKNGKSEIMKSLCKPLGLFHIRRCG